MELISFGFVILQDFASLLQYVDFSALLQLLPSVPLQLDGKILGDGNKAFLFPLYPLPAPST